MAKSHAARWASDSPTPAQLKEFFAQIESGKVTSLRLQELLRGEKFSKRSKKGDFSEFLLEQVRFYLEVFDRKIDPTVIKPPSEAEGFNWILHMAEGLTPMQIWEKIVERKIQCYKYWNNLDEVVSDRDPRKGGYTIRLRDRIEADEELKNKSADDLKREGISGITLSERLLLGLFYFWKSGGHLDLQNITLCSGSRNPGGDVPDVYWCDDGVYVDWYDPDYRSGRLRSRAVIS